MSNLILTYKTNFQLYLPYKLFSPVVLDIFFLFVVCFCLDPNIFFQGFSGFSEIFKMCHGSLNDKLPLAGSASLNPQEIGFLSTWYPPPNFSPLGGGMRGMFTLCLWPCPPVLVRVKRRRYSGSSGT
jgi:hypothetical protein